LQTYQYVLYVLALLNIPL